MFAKSGNNTINIITGIASFGVVVGSLALFIILSGFSGLRTFSDGLLEVSDPDVKITSAIGKSFFYTDSIHQLLTQDRSLAYFSKVVEERVFLSYEKNQHIAYIKGVDAVYHQITRIDSSLYLGNWLDPRYKNGAVIGNGIAYKLSVNMLNYGEPLQIAIPKKGKGFINPTNPFYTENAQIVGVYSGSEEFQNKFVFTDILLAQHLLKYKENQITGIAIKLKEEVDVDAIAKQLQEELGNTYKVQTKAQLNELFYKVINTENFISYLIFTLIVIVAMFTIVGAMIMIIIDKRENLKTLLSLGTTLKQIKKIFVLQGFLLTFFGMATGLILGIFLVFLQQKLALFMITQTIPYPVEFRFINLIVVVATIAVLGYLASKIASSKISLDFIEG